MKSLKRQHESQSLLDSLHTKPSTRSNANRTSHDGLPKVLCHWWAPNEIALESIFEGGGSCSILTIVDPLWYQQGLNGRAILDFKFNVTRHRAIQALNLLIYQSHTS